MNWLIWKDYRLQRPILIVGAAITLLPFFAPLTVLAANRIFHDSPQVTLDDLYGPLQWLEMCSASVVTVVLTMALLGGNAIAGERSNRAAEFFAYLPVSRWRSLRSKLIVPAFALLTVVGLNVIIALIVQSFVHYDLLRSRVLEGRIYFILWAGLAAASAFSVSWCLSSFLESPTFAVAGGLLLPWLAIAIPTAIIYWALGEPSHRAWVWIYLVVLVSLSGLTFPLGTYIYLRRVQP